MRLSYLATTVSSALVLGAGASFAGGIVAPVVDTTPIIVAPVMATSWAGAYVGGSLGYITGTDDQVGLALFESGAEIDSVGGLGDVGVSGPTVGLQLGYRWQRDNWVFGPELGIELGGVDERVEFGPASEGLSVESEVNNIATLVLKTGYIVNPNTMVYGTLGVARGDFDYTLGGNGESQTQGFTLTGAAAGLGVERMMNERISVFAEYQYRDFGNETVDYTDGVDSLRTQASMTMSSIKIGANFRF